MKFPTLTEYLENPQEYEEGVSQVVQRWKTATEHLKMIERMTNEERFKYRVKVWKKRVMHRFVGWLLK